MNDSITQIPLDNPGVYAFTITGQISDDALEAMAKTMNAAFDAHEEKVDMLLVFQNFSGSDADAMFDMDVMKAQFSSLSNVKRYVTVGAPESASKMIDMMGSMTSIETHTLAAGELDEAYRLLSANPVSTTANA